MSLGPLFDGSYISAYRCHGVRSLSAFLTPFFGLSETGCFLSGFSAHLWSGCIKHIVIPFGSFT